MGGGCAHTLGGDVACCARSSVSREFCAGKFRELFDSSELAWLSGFYLCFCQIFLVIIIFGPFDASESTQLASIRECDSCGAKSGTLAVRRRNLFQSFVNFVFLLQIMFWQTVLILWATVPVYLGANFARFIPRVL